jgi:hypothetical protein
LIIGKSVLRTLISVSIIISLQVLFDVQFKSTDDLKKALGSSDVVEVEKQTFPLLLDSKGMNALLYSDPFSKICFTCSLVSGFLKQGKVVYVDLDTVFTSYTKNHIFDVDSGDLEIFLPSENEFERILSDICSHLDANTVLVVVDSLNSFYHLYDKIKVGSLNRLLSAYVSLLLNHTRRIRCALLITSMIRHKKTSEWLLAPSSKRLIEAKSSVILNAQLGAKGLIVDIVKNQPLKLHSKKLVIAKDQIPIRV